MKTVAETLTNLKNLIGDPSRWTTGACARDEYGHEVDIDSPRAVSFCLLGGMAKVVEKNDDGDEYGQAISQIQSIVGMFGISVYNDSHTHAENMALLDTAIATAKSC